MSGKNLSYREVLEQFPTYASKNQFNILENLDEFPSLHRESYRDQLAGKKSKFVFRENRKRSISARKKPDATSQYYSLHTHATMPTAPMPENHNRVSEVEKEIALTLHAVKPTIEFANNDSICDITNDSISSETEITNKSSKLEEEQGNNSTDKHLPSI